MLDHGAKPAATSEWEYTRVLAAQLIGSLQSCVRANVFFGAYLVRLDDRQECLSKESELDFADARDAGKLGNGPWSTIEWE